MNQTALPRKPWTEPYTIRERLSIKRGLFEYDVRAFLREGIWRRLARRLPHRLAYFATIRAYSDAWVDNPTKHPDELTFTDVLQPWERKR